METKNIFSVNKMDEHHDGEIVGLHYHSNGRSCNQHACCGRILQSGHVVRFKCDVMDVLYEHTDGVVEDVRREMVMKVIHIKDGTEMCHVGFLPKYILARPREVARLADQFAMIIDIYHDDDAGSARKTTSIKNNGMASYRLLQNIPRQE